MEVYIMFDICTYCLFTLYGRGVRGKKLNFNVGVKNSSHDCQSQTSCHRHHQLRNVILRREQ